MFTLDDIMIYGIPERLILGASIIYIVYDNDIDG